MKGKEQTTTMQSKEQIEIMQGKEQAHKTKANAKKKHTHRHISEKAQKPLVFIFLWFPLVEVLR